MRLSQHEIDAIREAVAAVFGDTASIRLFGSRLDDRARGGDIDLYIEVPPVLSSARHEIALRRELLKRLGERRIDVVVRPFGGGGTAIDRIAIQTGAPL